MAGAVCAAWGPELLCLDVPADAAMVAADPQRAEISAGAAVLVAAAAAPCRRAEHAAGDSGAVGGSARRETRLAVGSGNRLGAHQAAGGDRAGALAIVA